MSLYVTDSGAPRIARVSLQGTVTPFTTSPAPSGNTFGLMVGTDGQIWVSENGSFIDRSTTAGARTVFSTPFAMGAQTIITGPDGSIWFTHYGSAALGRLSLPSGTATEFPVPLGTNPFGLLFAPDGTLWGVVRRINRLRGAHERQR